MPQPHHLLLFMSLSHAIPVALTFIEVDSSGRWYCFSVFIAHKLYIMMVIAIKFIHSYGFIFILFSPLSLCRAVCRWLRRISDHHIHHIKVEYRKPAPNVCAITQNRRSISRSSNRLRDVGETPIMISSRADSRTEWPVKLYPFK